MTKRSHRGVLLLAIGLTAWGCAPEPQRKSEAGPQVFTVALQVGTVGSLPTCNQRLAGTTAFVESPASFWSCNGTWLPIPCTKVLAGAVAYASATQTLYACTAGNWTRVALPAGTQGAPGEEGPAGPTGPAGTDGTSALIATASEPAGTNCAAGGVKIDSGGDSNFNGFLDGDEVVATAYVCNAVQVATCGPCVAPETCGGGGVPNECGSPFVTLSVAKVGSGAGTVTSGLVGIECGADCDERYPRGSLVSLTATPDADFVFGGWTGACTGLGVCTIAMDEATSVEATFLAAKPDLVAVALDCGLEVAMPDDEACTAEIRNSGPTAVQSFSYSLWLSQSPLPNPASGVRFATCSGGPLAPGEALQATCSGFVPVTAPRGNVHVILVVDEEQAVDELNESNNRKPVPIYAW